MKTILLSVLLSACASDRALTVAWATTSVQIECDWSQTTWAGHGGRWDRLTPDGTAALREMNPLLGQTPTQGTLNFAVAADQVVNGAVLVSPLPRWVKWAWFGIILARESWTLVNNAKNVPGVCGL